MVFWYFRISCRALVPGLYLLFFLGPPEVDSVACRADVVAPLARDVCPPWKRRVGKNCRAKRATFVSPSASRTPLGERGAGKRPSDVVERRVRGNGRSSFPFPERLARAQSTRNWAFTPKMSRARLAREGTASRPRPARGRLLSRPYLLLSYPALRPRHDPLKCGQEIVKPKVLRSAALR